MVDYSLKNKRGRIRLRGQALYQLEQAKIVLGNPRKGDGSDNDYERVVFVTIEPLAKALVDAIDEIERLMKENETLNKYWDLLMGVQEAKTIEDLDKLKPKLVTIISKRT